LPVPLDLPVFYRRLFAIQSSQPPEPKDAGPEVRLGSEVIEQQARFSRRHGNIETVGHEQEDVHVVRLGLRRHEGPEHDHPREVSGPARNGVEPFQPEEHPSALRSPGAKTFADLVESGVVNAEREVLGLRERRQRQLVSLLSVPYAMRLTTGGRVKPILLASILKRNAGGSNR
jgi:hypothetical protein